MTNPTLDTANTPPDSTTREAGTAAEATAAPSSAATQVAQASTPPSAVVDVSGVPVGGAPLLSGQPLNLTWSIPPNGDRGDARTFIDLTLFTTGTRTPAPELYSTSEGFGGHDTHVQDIADLKTVCANNGANDVNVNQVSCVLNDLFRDNGTLNVIITPPGDITSSDQFYFGFKYQLDGTNGDGDVYFYSTAFTIEEDDTGTTGTTGTTGPTFNSASAASTSSTTTSAISSTSTPSAPSTPTLASSFSTSTTSPSLASTHHSLSTGAKVAIAIGSIGAILLLAIAALLLIRRSRKHRFAHPSRRARASSDFSPDRDRDLHAEKEMPVTSTASSPYEAIPAAILTGTQPDQRASWADPQGGAQGDASTEPYRDHDRDVAAAVPPRAPTPPPNQQRYSLVPDRGVAAAGMSQLHEPGMSPEQLARLEEEERRLDEAIAEAERRRR